eukprot:scaffold58838_cov54-Phaeocystis_antarctica.AAC.2
MTECCTPPRPSPSPHPSQPALALALALTLTRYDYDGELYSREDFVAEYGGTREWEQARLGLGLGLQKQHIHNVRSKYVLHAYNSARRDPLWAAAAVAAAQSAAKAAAEAQVAASRGCNRGCNRIHRGFTRMHSRL